ncbi:MAG: hypothetical protein EON59_07320 [Alphaproteobacteria bacterium]|nr:MAG: hypothetical protein EON59_07320 [Alphaproteobacteria bacterium]
MPSAQSSFERTAHGVHALFLSFPIALFSAALATDISYVNTAQIQWTNFSSWLIAGALVFGGAVIAFALLQWILDIRRPFGRASLIYLLVVIVMWGVGLVNAFHHSRDAWSSVGTAGLAMSVVCTVLALIAGWILFSRPASWEFDR